MVPALPPKYTLLLSADSAGEFVSSEPSPPTDHSITPVHPSYAYRVPVIEHTYSVPYGSTTTDDVSPPSEYGILDCQIKIPPISETAETWPLEAKTYR